MKGNARILIVLLWCFSTIGGVVGSDSSYLNVYGDALEPCSSDGMALTGYTRTGYCVDQNDDQGSHHICIDVSSANGGSFCDVTGQDDWCSSEMPCDGDEDSYCEVQQWCVCQWAFSSYLNNAGGCDMIQDIVCESINIQAVWAYQGNSKYSDALDCLASRCGLDLNSSYLKSSGNTGANGTVVWLAVTLAIIAAGAFIGFKSRSSSDKNQMLEEDYAEMGGTGGSFS
jgi:uncharacterized protein (DUF2237 family)